MVKKMVEAYERIYNKKSWIIYPSVIASTNIFILKFVIFIERIYKFAYFVAQLYPIYIL